MYITVETFWRNEIKMIGKDSFMLANDLPIAKEASPIRKVIIWRWFVFDDVQGFYDI
jgi:hypothetical protein